MHKKLWEIGRKSSSKRPLIKTEDRTYMSQRTKCKDYFIVVNEKGLHTRPATELVKCASSFRAQVRLIYQDLTVNAKSMLGILMLAAAKGAKVFVEAEGEDATEAIEAIINLAQHKFHIKY